MFFNIFERLPQEIQEGDGHIGKRLPFSLTIVDMSQHFQVYEDLSSYRGDMKGCARAIVEVDYDLFIDPDMPHNYG